MLTTYGDVLRRPGAALFSVTGLISRLPLSMTGLGLVLLVSDRSDSYARAGLIAAVYVLAAAATAPAQGRLADRWGQGPVLIAVGTLYAIGMTATMIAIDRDLGIWTLGATAAIAGVGTPQSGNMVRARWTKAVVDRTQLNTAFAIEAVVDEAVFIVGPVLVTFLTLHVADFAGLIVATCAATLGSWALAAQRATTPPRAVRTDERRPPIGWDLLGPVVFASVGLGVLFGSTEVIVVAFATDEGQRGAAGVLLAIWATGSLVAGVAVGSLPSPRDPARRLRFSLLGLTLLFIPLLFLPNVASLAFGMFAAGVMISPTLIAAVGLIETYVPPSRLTEGLGWTSTGLSIGVAPGAAAAGWVVDHYTASAGFAVPLVAGLLATAVAWTFSPPQRDIG